MQRMSEGMCGLGRVRLVRPPRGPWTARAQRHNVHTSEAFSEILAEMRITGIGAPVHLLRPARLRR